MRNDHLPVEGFDVLRDNALAAQNEAVTRVLDPGEVLWVRACPGAGKTRVIVDRHLAQPSPGRQGCAIASFTRAASREVRSRIISQGGLASAGHPNAITTLDTFFWRHLVRPYLGVVKDAGHEWNRLDSWEEHPFSADSENGLTLDDFKFPATGPIMGPSAKRKIRNSGISQDQALAWAGQRYAWLTGKGHMTGTQLRQHAREKLSDPDLAVAIGATLTTRFTELVVDEAQDCSDADEELLLRLSRLGLPLLLVADTDQAIYGFRRDESDRASATEVLPRDNTIRLRHNWRSSQDLCRFTATLRGDSEPDIAVGPHRDEGAPVLLLPHARGESHPLRVFRTAAERMGIDQEETLVVAHHWGTLPPELTGTAKAPPGDLARLVWAAEVFSAPTPGKKSREQARRALRAALLDVWCEPGADSMATEAERLRATGIDAALFDRAEALVRYELPMVSLPLEEWEPRMVSALYRHSPYPVQGRAPGRVRWTEPAMWDRKAPAHRLYSDSAVSVDPLPEVGRTSSVHGVKGEEADAVLLMIPPRRGGRGGVNRWIDPSRTPGQDVGEDVRVLYVAATRARRLLALALPEDDLKKVSIFLDQRGVPYALTPRAHQAEEKGSLM